MFRFIHCADIHLDSPLRGLALYANAPVEVLRNATRRALANLVDFALARRVDFVVIAGDVYDGNLRDYHAVLYFRNQMVRLARENIPVYLLSGNHDAANLMTRILRLPEGVHQFAHDAAKSFIHPNLPVALHGRGFTERAEFDNLARTYPAAVPGHYNIGVLHTALQGREGHDTYAPCSLDDLIRLGYDYWALGHVHTREEVCADPPVHFPGNLQGRHIRETGEKGCLLVTVEAGKTLSVEFAALDVLRWEHLELDVSEAETLDDILDQLATEMSTALQTVDRDLLALRVSLFGATALHDDLLGASDRIHAEVQAIAQELDPEGLWIERVRLRTRRICETVAGDLSGLEEALRAVVDELANNPDARSEWLDEVSDLLKKLPVEMDAESQITSLRNGDGLREHLEDLSGYLRARLRAGDTG